MALLSDVDWIILLGVAAILLFGRENTELLRTLGRWYGRAIHLKQELLSEVTRAVEIPAPLPDRPISVRSTLLGWETEPVDRSHVPLAVATVTAVSHAAPSALTWVNSVGPQQWSIATTRFPEFEGGGR